MGFLGQVFSVEVCGGVGAWSEGTLFTRWLPTAGWVAPESVSGCFMDTL